MSVSKIVAAAASGVGGAGLDVDEVFSTYLYTGTGSSLAISNGIDLNGEGGLVWTKRRSSANSNWFLDSVRGGNQILRSNTTEAQFTSSGLEITSFNSNGYTLGTANDINSSSQNDVSWTFRKAPKFFDVVTYTGTGSAREISHNLGTTVGFMTIKKTSQTGDWMSFHRSASGKWLMLNSTDAATTNIAAEVFGNDSTYIAPSSTVFSVGSETSVNASGQTYVAYLFAHNNNDGEFGPDSDQDIIKCGSFIEDGTGKGSVTLGFEPQFVMTKVASRTGNWNIFDTMRGYVNTSGNDDAWLEPNTSDAESSYQWGNPTATGFEFDGGYGSETHIYMAIRRGPLAAPEDATKVFAIDHTATTTAPKFRASFAVDMALQKEVNVSESWYNASRLTQGKYLVPQATDAEAASSNFIFDYNNGWSDQGGDNWTSWMWKRAPSYFDVVAYTGDGQAGRTVSHNLGVTPEMIWVKRRDSSTNGDWWVYHAGAQDSPTYVDVLKLNSTDAVTDSSGYFAGNPTASNFSVNQYNTTNGSGNTYIAYLFATVAGVSKVGSFSPTGSTLNVDCGFSSGARFVLAKQTDSSGEWYLWDSTRGIVAGNDPYLFLDSSGAETTNADYIDPHSSGFTITSSFFGSGNFIFYAIA